MLIAFGTDRHYGRCHFHAVFLWTHLFFFLLFFSKRKKCPCICYTHIDIIACMQNRLALLIIWGCIPLVFSRQKDWCLILASRSVTLTFIVTFPKVKVNSRALVFPYSVLGLHSNVRQHHCDLPIALNNDLIVGKTRLQGTRFPGYKNFHFTSWLYDASLRNIFCDKSEVAVCISQNIII